MPKSKQRRKLAGKARRPKTLKTHTKNMQDAPAKKKGVYTEYLDAQLTLEGITAERKRQLKKISVLRGGRAVLVIAADLNKGHAAPTSITYSDLVPFNDQLGVLDGDKIDVILETPGGLGEVAEDMVKLLRHKFSE